MLKMTFTLILGSFVLFGCANNISTIGITPKIQLPQQDPSLMGITISISSNDQRSEQFLAQINRRGKLITITPSRDLRFLLQEILEKQMIARGYMIGPYSEVNLWVIINNLYSNINEGNIRHEISSYADISIVAQAKNGNKQTKRFRSMYSTVGILNASNHKISNSINNVLENIISDMANDSSINNFIKRNTR